MEEPQRRTPIPLRILVATEYPYYREALSRALRPHAVVCEAHQADVDRATVWLLPDFVILSRPSEVVETRAPGYC